MIKENYGFIITHNPMLAIMLLLWAFNLLGNGLRNALVVKEGCEYLFDCWRVEKSAGELLTMVLFRRFLLKARCSGLPAAQCP